MAWRQEKTISLKDGMMPRKMQLSFRLKKMNKVPSRLKSVQLDITSIWSYNTMSAGILDGFQTIIPTAAAVLSEKRQILRLTQQEVANRAKITLRQYQRLESGERNILTSSFGLACRVIEALDMDVSKFYHGDYYLEEEVKTMRGKGIASRKKSSI